MAQGRSALSDAKEYPPKRASHHLRCFSIDRRGYSGLDQETASAPDYRVSPMSLTTSKRLLDELSRSEIYKDYERAFGEATGLPLNLRSLEHFQLAHHGKVHENPFCALMAKHSRTCAACLEAQQKSSHSATSADADHHVFRGVMRIQRPPADG